MTKVWQEQRTNGSLWAFAFIAAMIGVILQRPILDLFRPAPVEIELSELERQFDKNAPAALAFWAGKPMILSGVVASGQGDSVALESIYVMAVHAKLNDRLEGHDGELIRLHCRDIEEGGIIGGKPQPLNCNIVSVGG